jgi:hypothetical protein
VAFTVAPLARRRKLGSCFDIAVRKAAIRSIGRWEWRKCRSIRLASELIVARKNARNEFGNLAQDDRVFLYPMDRGGVGKGDPAT